MGQEEDKVLSDAVKNFTAKIEAMEQRLSDHIRELSGRVSSLENDMVRKDDLSRDMRELGGRVSSLESDMMRKGELSRALDDAVLDRALRLGERAGGYVPARRPLEDPGESFIGSSDRYRARRRWVG